MEEAKISERVLEYVRSLWAGAALPIMVEAGISGYVQYYRNRK
jgi:hypothetical protein